MTRKKKIIREPVEKLSSDNIVEITESSSSEEEESDLTPIIKPKAVKKPRSAKALANDQRLRDRKKKVEPVIDEMDISTHPVKSVPVAEVDDEDKPATTRQLKALMAQMNAKPEPVKKPRKPRATKVEMEKRKAEKVVIETPPPTPPPPTPLKRAPPQMMFV